MPSELSALRLRFFLRHRNRYPEQSSFPARFDRQFAVELAGAFAHAPDSKARSSQLNVRELFAAIPLDRLRSAGILESLLRLAGLAADTAPASPADAGPDGESDEIDDMTRDELVQLARRGGR